MVTSKIILLLIYSVNNPDFKEWLQGLSGICRHFDLTRLGFHGNWIPRVHTAEHTEHMALVAVCSWHKIWHPIIHINTVLLAANVNVLTDCKLNCAVKCNEILLMSSQSTITKECITDTWLQIFMAVYSHRGIFWIQHNLMYLRYLTMLSVIEKINDTILIWKGCRRMWLCLNLRYHPVMLLQGMRITMKIPSQDSRKPGQDANLVPLYNTQHEYYAS
jgi:hypothetical protein